MKCLPCLPPVAPDNESIAYSWDYQGKDRFTRTYPSVNKLVGVFKDNFANWIGDTALYSIINPTSSNSYTPSILSKPGGTTTQLAFKNRVFCKKNDVIVMSFYVIAKGVKSTTQHFTLRAFSEKDKGYFEGESIWHINYDLKNDYEGLAVTTPITVPMDGWVTPYLYNSDTKGTVNIEYSNLKLIINESDVRPFTSAPEDNDVNSKPTYIGTGYNLTENQKNDPSKYTWKIYSGNS